MKNDFNLASILEHVAEGKTPVTKAKNLIEKHFSQDEMPSGKKVLRTGAFKFKESVEKKAGTNSSKKMYAGDKAAKLRRAFDKLKKSVHLDELLKISSQFVHQISENVPQKIQDNFSPIGFSAKIAGVDSKLSVFRAVQVSPDNSLEENLVVGCQWFGLTLKKQCSMKHNKFTAMQMTELSLIGSDLNECSISLSRMSHVTLQDSCFAKNKLALSTWSDTSLTESDFTENSLSRSDLSGTIINSSRLSKCGFLSANFKDCEFDACDIQGLEFDNCEFKECSFSEIKAINSVPMKISNRHFTGKQFANCTSVEEFLELLQG